MAYIVPVKKNNGQIRCCIDFHDFNRACSKDEFPLPNIDVLVDAIAGHLMFYFMDDFSGDNQIKMDPIRNYLPDFNGQFSLHSHVIWSKKHWSHLPTHTAIFSDMLHDYIEYYVDDIVVKSKEVSHHVNDLRRVFLRCRRYNLRMNPLKCALGVSSGKFLGLISIVKGLISTWSKPRKFKIWSLPSLMKS